MKIFIAGARAIANLDEAVIAKLDSISENGYEVLVGDALGADRLVQQFYVDKAYRNVTVFASNGEARNNLGDWRVENIAVKRTLRGFDYYKQKDVAMANAADYGLMIWNGESRGTLNNIVNLLRQEKDCVVYLVSHKRFFNIDSEDKLLSLLKLCPSAASSQYKKLAAKEAPSYVQIAMF